MNIQNLHNNDDFYFFINRKVITKDVAFYSLMNALKSYFETYYKSFFHFGSYEDYDEDDLNNFAQASDEYISSYVDIVIHLQHFLN